jgi:hypothetical protein
VYAFVVELVVGELVVGLASTFDSSSAVSGRQSSSVVESVDAEVASVADVVMSAEVVLVSTESTAIVVVTARVFAEPLVDRGDLVLGELAPPPDDPPDDPSEDTRTSAQLKNSSGVWPTAVHDFCFGCAPVAPPSQGHPAHAAGYLYWSINPSGALQVFCVSQYAWMTPCSIVTSGILYAIFPFGPPRI